MPGPFELLGGLFLAVFKITGYFFVCLVQAVWYAVCRKPDKIGDAFGYFGRGAVDAISDIFKSNRRR
jgi:hypothetical protein